MSMKDISTLITTKGKIIVHGGKTKSKIYIIIIIITIIIITIIIITIIIIICPCRARPLQLFSSTFVPAPSS